jgi:hypothetical protein
VSVARAGTSRHEQAIVSYGCRATGYRGTDFGKWLSCIAIFRERKAVLPLPGLLCGLAGKLNIRESQRRRSLWRVRYDSYLDAASVDGERKMTGAIRLLTSRVYRLPPHNSSCPNHTNRRTSLWRYLDSVFRRNISRPIGEFGLQ